MSKPLPLAIVDQINITLKVSSYYNKDELHVWQDKITYPCGDYKYESHIQYFTYDKSAVASIHLRSCHTCRVRFGLSAQTKGLKQTAVVDNWLNGLRGTSKTGNYYTGDDGKIIWHYSTIETFKTQNGTVVINSDCYAKGWGVSCERWAIAEKCKQLGIPCVRLWENLLLGHLSL